MTMFIDTEKEFDKIQYPFVVKPSAKEELRELISIL